ncbi:hypothetical protein GCM10009744_26790 [Kribbella alba]|uniref:Uncharacterized protein n=1 Tax=Kribbella alba TaxID=190197 RepID=A0ABN2F9B3_9ACTN
MKKRAQALREAARRAKALAPPLGTHIDKAVTSATADGVWHGPYAIESTRSLMQDQKNLRELAADLVVSADSWIREAEKLEADAKAAEPAPK